MNGTRVGIEALNLFAGLAYMDVKTIFEGRGNDLDRFDNLMMERKAVNLPCEDPVTNGVNAAKPILDQLSEEDRNKIEMLITSSESGLDFGKSISTYIHEHLGLSRHCRLFEVKQACYGGTAALQMAASYVMAHRHADPKVLVIATDVARTPEEFSLAEPSQGTGAVAFLISSKPEILELDFGASGLYSFEVMDTCRPTLDTEMGDSDLSLYSYLDCLEHSFQAYSDRVDGVDFGATFDYLVFHTPFAGMVKGAHRQMMRTFTSTERRAIEGDFQKRMEPSLAYSKQVGNLYSASVYMALASLIDRADVARVSRVGLFSYGSGCSSEFFSGLISPASKAKLAQMGIQEHLNRRHSLSMREYDQLLAGYRESGFGVRNNEFDVSAYRPLYDRTFAGRQRLALKRIENYHREYGWV